MCCGWEAPRDETLLDGLMFVEERVARAVQGAIRRIEGMPVTIGDYCTNCDVMVPRSDSMCMI